MSKYTETELHPLTKAAIQKIITDWPRKKNILKEFLFDYKCEAVDELSEELGLEILEILDSETYVKVVKQKDQLERDAYHQMLIDEVNEYIRLHNEDYMILDKVTDCWLLTKKINLLVQHKNNNSTFQPYETIQEKEYWINIIVKTSDAFKPSPLIESFMTRNCRMIKIYEITSIERAFKGIN